METPCATYCGDRLALIPAPEAGAARLVLLRDLRRRHRRAHARADSGRRIGLIAVTLVAVLAEWVFYSPAELAKPGFNPPTPPYAGRSRLCQQHRVADLRCLHVRSRLRKDRLGNASRCCSCGRWDARRSRGLCGGSGGHTARAVHAIEHRAQRRHDLSRDPQPAAPLRLEAERPFGRRIGSYIMWTAIATTCVTSSMFLTAPGAQPAGDGAGQESGQRGVSGCMVLAFAPVRDHDAWPCPCSPTCCTRRR